MTINHINLVLSDVPKATLFFETYFDFKCIAVKGDSIITVLKNTSGFTLVLMDPKLQKNNDITYPEAFHIGFMQDSADQVNEIYLRLKTGGIPIEREPAKIRDGFGFYFHFDSIMIEVGTN